MFKVTIQDESERTVFKIEGKLAQPWVAELRECWSKTIRPGGKPVLVDVRAVTFVTPEGKQLLREIHRAGARFLASGPMMNSIVEQITAETVAER